MTSGQGMSISLRATALWISYPMRKAKLLGAFVGQLRTRCRTYVRCLGGWSRSIGRLDDYVHVLDDFVNEELGIRPVCLRVLGPRSRSLGIGAMGSGIVRCRDNMPRETLIERPSSQGHGDNSSIGLDS